MAIEFIKLYKPGRGCGSTQTIFKIANNLIEQNIRIAIITSFLTTKRQWEELDVWEGKEKLNIFTVQDICQYQRGRGIEFDVIIFCDYPHIKNSAVEECLCNLRTSIVIKEIEGTPPYEIYN